jgi:signal transduction histidine kinase
MANEAAHRMLGVSKEELAGKLLYRYLPALTNITMHDPTLHLLRAVMQARGLREDGETFLADICFSTYRTNAGTRLAAMVIDTSEDLRAHEVSGLQQLLAGSRIAVGGVFHEVRNVCNAIALVHQNLAQSGMLKGNKDFEALGSLAVALERIANVNVHQTTTSAAEIDLTILLEELKIVVSPTLQEENITARWHVEPALPLVWADRPSLMQVFLNLVTNSIRALSKREVREFSISAKVNGNQVAVEFVDTGGGVAYPEFLFRPFQEGAQSTGLGLYLSRAFAQSFGGDLQYKAVPRGACFIVSVMASAPSGQEI